MNARTYLARRQHALKRYADGGDAEDGRPAFAEDGCAYLDYLWGIRINAIVNGVLKPFTRLGCLHAH